VQASNKLSFDLGMVNYGQSRDVVVRATNPSDLSVHVQCRLPGRSVEMVGVFGPDDPLRCAVQKARAQVVKAVADARRLGRGSDGVGGDLAAALAVVGKVAEGVRDLADALPGGEEAEEKYVSDLLQDLEGQIAMSVSREDWFNRWGVHYLPSILRAHVLQQCLNFKDPGMQHYGGELFREVRDVADDRFNELPAPTPSIVHRPSYVGGTMMSAPAAAAPINMATFNNAAGGCFASGLVLLASGERRPVAEIAAGDRLAVGGGVVVVDRVVETRFSDEQTTDLVDLGDGVLATPWHPVRAAGGDWRFPADIKPTVSLHVPAVYCFFLEDGGSYTIGGWEAVALGHELQGPVVSHPFFASRERVAKSLDALPTANGRVILRGGQCLERDSDGLVSGFRAPDCAEDAETIAATKMLAAVTAATLAQSSVFHLFPTSPESVPACWCA
jgi:hypothetical protein